MPMPEPTNSNYPSVTNIVLGAGIHAQGQMISGTSQTYRCEFFALNVPQGMIFLGATNISTTPTGTSVFSVVINSIVPTSAFVVVTATDAGGNTSELSLI